LQNRFTEEIFAARADTNSLSKTVFSVKPLFKRFQQFKRFEKSLYGLKDRSLKANWYEILSYAQNDRSYCHYEPENIATLSAAYCHPERSEGSLFFALFASFARNKNICHN
jgi:hypothetical protein